MAFKKLTAPTLTDLFVSELEKMILSGELKVGDKLPPERQLANEMNVSLAVINAGINRLTSLGFLMIAPRKGVFVADYIRDGNIDTLKEVIEYNQSEPDQEVLEPVSQFRRGIELSATKAACINSTSNSLERLKSLINQIEADKNADLAELGFQFHHEIGIASGNTYYPMIIQSFKPLYIMFYRMNSSKERNQAILNSLKETFEAIEKRDTQLAEKAINDSIGRWLNSFNRG